MLKSIAAVLVVAAVLALATPSHGLGCLDLNGKPVDWWFIYKFPNNGTTGKAYAYYDQNTGTLEEQADLIDQNSALAYTLKQTYAASSTDTAWIMYNDQPPGEGPGSDTRAHAKGVVTFTSSGGFWVSHSTPLFPPANKDGGSFSYPDSGTTYGQTFLCQSYDWDQFETLAQQQQINRVNVFDSNLPDFAKTGAPTWTLVVEEEESDTSNNIVPLSSSGGFAFLNFAKGRAWASDLYSQLVAPKLGQDLLCETWMRPDMPDYCSSPYTVMNVQTLEFPGGRDWKETKDHAKWCVAQATSSNWVCVGDINRMCSQRKRGGGTTCFQDSTLHTALRNMIQTWTECTKSDKVKSEQVSTDKDGVPHRYRARLVTPSRVEPQVDICADDTDVALSPAIKK